MPSGLFIAKTVFGPSIHGRGTLSTDFFGDDTMTHQLTIIAESTEAEIPMPNQNALQRSLSKIFPLGIRSAEETNDDNTSKSNDLRHDYTKDKRNRTADMSSVDKGVSQERAPRRNDAFETRAYEVIHDFKRQLDALPTKCSSLSPKYIYSSGNGRPATSKSGISGRSYVQHDQKAKLSGRAPKRCRHNIQPPRRTTIPLPYGFRNRIQPLATTTSTLQHPCQRLWFPWSTRWRHDLRLQSRRHDLQSYRMYHHRVFLPTANPVL
ncbi:hypothetical protein Aduo_015213 [Ancylostoma duodenale]